MEPFTSRKIWFLSEPKQKPRTIGGLIVSYLVDKDLGPDKNVVIVQSVYPESITSLYSYDLTAPISLLPPVASPMPPITIGHTNFLSDDDRMKAFRGLTTFIASTGQSANAKLVRLVERIGILSAEVEARILGVLPAPILTPAVLAPQQLPVTPQAAVVAPPAYVTPLAPTFASAYVAPPALVTTPIAAPLAPAATVMEREWFGGVPVNKSAYAVGHERGMERGALGVVATPVPAPVPAAVVEDETLII